jgi:hypothetical protein
MIFLLAKVMQDLASVRDRVAAELQLDSSIIAPRAALDATANDLSSPALMNWQRRLLELPLLASPASTEI